MSSPLTLENRLILACVCAEPEFQDIQALAQGGPDWLEILRKTEQWGLGPLVYIRLRHATQSSQVPRPVAERLRHLYYREAIHGIARRDLLPAALVRFAGASVPVIVLKGAALATLTYRSPTLRPVRGIDLLVHPRDRTRVETVLLSLRDALGAPAEAGTAADVHPDIRYLGLTKSLSCSTYAMASSIRAGQTRYQQPFASQSKTSGIGRAPSRSRRWPRWCSVTRICSCTSRCI